MKGREMKQFTITVVLVLLATVLPGQQKEPAKATPAAPPATTTAPKLSDVQLKKIAQFEAQHLLLANQRQQIQQQYADIMKSLGEQEQKNAAAYGEYISHACPKGFEIKLGKNATDDASCQVKDAPSTKK
jgi:hypothetical protein